MSLFPKSLWLLRVHNQISWITPSLSHQIEISLSCPVFKWECSKYPSICTLVTFRLNCNHTRNSLGLSFGEWRLAVTLEPFLSSQVSEHLSWRAWESIIAPSWGKHLSPGNHNVSKNSSARGCPKFTLTYFHPVKHQKVGYFHSLLQNSDEGFILHLHNRN